LLHPHSWSTIEASTKSLLASDLGTYNFFRLSSPSADNEGGNPGKDPPWFIQPTPRQRGVKSNASREVFESAVPIPPHRAAAQPAVAGIEPVTNSARR
jgi:hypothetical protein